MSYAYSHNAGASSLPSFKTNSAARSRGLLNQGLEKLPATAKQWIAEGAASFRAGPSKGSNFVRGLATSFVKRYFTVANAVVWLWFFTLWWGERTVFKEAINKCVWESWEKWPEGATPHHVAFVADPQLVDPHTYPGRPWPLSTLTVKYTDQYLRRSFSSIQKDLTPDSVLFLGDLFDGGREWATQSTVSPEKRYRKIKDSFWKKEYGRFMKIFLDPWLQQNPAAVDGRGRRIIASLPGNHDLGFANGIQEPVRRRFQSYFGNGNRVDIIGNHTFVSVDTVSLSAMDQPDPLTGSSPSTIGSSDHNELHIPIWKEPGDFLNKLAIFKAKAETEELRVLQNLTEDMLFKHRILEPGDDAVEHLPEPKAAGFPTILLTHVPLYRKPATPCGPLRERYPPAAPNLEVDEPNSLKIAGGYQYQNVLTPTISNELVSKAGPNVVQVYSGDDHDYCEVIHREFNGSPNEITVKSLSWAMGVRHPGFVLTSLWNPIDPVTGESISKGSAPSIQNHLCLLPDQLGIFIHYASVLGLSITILLLHSVYTVLFAPRSSASNGSVLPLSEQRAHSPRHQYQTSGTSSSTFPSLGGLASRGGITPSPRYPGAKAYHDTYRGLGGDDVVTNSKDKGLFHPARATSGLRGKADLVARHFVHSVKVVSIVVLTTYFVMIWRW